MSPAARNKLDDAVNNLLGLSRLSAGDLAQSIAEPFPPEYERLRADFKGARARLQDAMRSVAASASAIRAGTAEIATASDDLSRRTEQQAASAGGDRGSARSRSPPPCASTADGAKHAQHRCGRRARLRPSVAGAVVRQAVSAMGEIEKSAQEIGQIIGVIDEIAFQANLLALNAGVEAARAGDAGPRLRRGGSRGAGPRSTLGRGREGDQAADLAPRGVQVEHGVAYVRPDWRGPRSGSSLASRRSTAPSGEIASSAAGASERALTK